MRIPRSSVSSPFVVTNTPGVLDVSVAEHALWLMGCLARKISRWRRGCVRASLPARSAWSCAARRSASSALALSVAASRPSHISVSA